MRGLVVPDRTEDFTADPVELFFDLAFVFAFSQLVAHLVHHPTWRGAAEAGLLFLLLWFPWSTFTWSANAVSGNAREVRALFLVATAATVPMAASVTTAFGAGGKIFGICGAVILVMSLALPLWGVETGSAEWRSSVRYGLPNMAAIVLLVLGGFLEDTPRTISWIIAVLIIIGATIAAGNSEWILRSGHFAERHGLIIIIALGEVIVAIGISVVNSLEDGQLPNETVVGLVAAGAMAGMMWWSYFDRVLPALEHRAEGLDQRVRGRFARDVYTYLHAPIVAGIILIAAAAEEVLLHPGDSVPGAFRLMFAAGLALFLGSVVGAVARSFSALARERCLAIAAFIALFAIAGSWDGVVLLIVIDVVLLAMLILEHQRIERRTSA